MGKTRLALELAASWVRLQPPTAIAVELMQGVDILHSPYHDLPPRQRSMQTVLDQNWQRLSAREQDVLARLSVFRGPFSSDGVQTAAGGDWAILAALVDKALLRLHPFPDETGAAG